MTAAEEFFSQLEGNRHQVFSQAGEDGALSEIFRRIGAGGRFFVEFGAKDGRYLSNTANLRMSYGWRGLLLDGAAPPRREGEAEGSKGLERLLSDASGARVQPAFVTAENVDGLFAQFGVPPVFDLLSIDIDGNDYWVWKALESHRPRVVIVEYNIFFGVQERRTIPYNAEHEWDRTGYHGATLAAFRDLGIEKGYALVYTDPYTPNAFFVSRDELGADWTDLSLEEVDRWGELPAPPDPDQRAWVTP